MLCWSFKAQIYAWADFAFDVAKFGSCLFVLGYAHGQGHHGLTAVTFHYQLLCGGLQGIGTQYGLFLLH
jgi:hypothetical protein